MNCATIHSAGKKKSCDEWRIIFKSLKKCNVTELNITVFPVIIKDKP